MSRDNHEPAGITKMNALGLKLRVPAVDIKIKRSGSWVSDTKTPSSDYIIFKFRRMVMDLLTDKNYATS